MTTIIPTLTMTAAEAKDARVTDDDNGLHWIPAPNMARLDSDIARLAKRANKIGVPAPSLITIGKVDVLTTRTNEFTGTKDDVVLHYSVVRVEGEAPKIAGWEFIATINALHAEDGESINLLSVVPGEIVPERYRTADATWCDHCRMDRNRKQVYVLRYDAPANPGDPFTLTYKQVGSSCLRDFLGHQDPNVIASWAEIIASLDQRLDGYEDDGGFTGSRGERATPLRSFLATTALVIRTYGWVSRSRANAENLYAHTITATVDIVRHINGDDGECKAGIKCPEYDLHQVEPSEQDRADADAAIMWATEENARDNDYLWNVYAIARAGYVTAKTAGIAASIVAVYQKARERLIEAERKERFKDSDANVHFGEVGKRTNMTLTVTKTDVYDGDYGDRTRVRFVNEKGNVAVWWASGNKTDEYEVGKSYTVKATVKNHEDWKGENQTILTRVAKEKKS